MPSTPTQLVRIAAATTNTTLYTNTNGTTTVISTIAITNTAATDATATIRLNAIDLLSAVSVPANSTVVIDNVRQILTGTLVLSGFASATTVNFHISGTVIS